MSLTNSPIEQRYADGDVIISEGIISNNAYFIISGQVKVTKKISNKTVVINQLGKGDVFGEMGLISQSVRSANVVAAGDVTLGIIDRKRFDDYLKTQPNDMQAIMTTLVDRLRFTSEQLANIGIQLEQTKNAIQSYTLK